MTKQVESNQALIFAEEAFVVDVQIILHRMMEEKGFDRRSLANAMGVPLSVVTQLFSDDCFNLNVRLLGRAFAVMRGQPVIGFR